MFHGSLGSPNFTTRLLTAWGLAYDRDTITFRRPVYALGVGPRSTHEGYVVYASGGLEGISGGEVGSTLSLHPEPLVDPNVVAVVMAGAPTPVDLPAGAYVVAPLRPLPTHNLPATGIDFRRQPRADASETSTLFSILAAAGDTTGLAQHAKLEVVAFHDPRAPLPVIKRAPIVVERAYSGLAFAQEEYFALHTAGRRKIEVTVRLNDSPGTLDVSPFACEFVRRWLSSLPGAVVECQAAALATTAALTTGTYQYEYESSADGFYLRFEPSEAMTDLVVKATARDF